MNRARKWFGGSRVDEEQLAHLRQQIEALEGELVEREAELVDLRVELSAFQLEYETKVARVLEELVEVEAQIERCQRAIERYRAGDTGGASPAGGGAYASVEEQYRRTWQEPEQWDPFAYVPPPGPATEAEIKALYRQLCRRFHPDLTQDERERAWRTEMMAAVNAAYEARSLAELQALARKPDPVLARAGALCEHRAGALREKLGHIRRRLREVARELRELMDGEMMELNLEVKLARGRGQDLLGEWSEDARRRLERKRVELDFVVSQLRQLGIAYE